jgi:hypothetical protein
MVCTRLPGIRKALSAEIASMRKVQPVSDCHRGPHKGGASALSSWTQYRSSISVRPVRGN